MMITLVIGGNSGIGKATAQWLNEKDVRVVLTPTVEELDVRVGSSVGEYIAKMTEGLHPNDRIEVVYSAGVNELEWIGELSEHALRQIWEVNVNGFLRVLDALRVNQIQDARIVAISSDAAERPMRTSIAYCSSKAALNMAVKCAAREMAGEGWRVNAVAPGMTSYTRMTHYIDHAVPQIRGWSAMEAMEYELQQAVIKRRAAPNEVAQAVQFFLEAPDYVNGAILAVNGGR